MSWKKLTEVGKQAKLRRFSRTNYFCSNCYKTYTEVYDYKLKKVVEGKVPEKCVKCQWLTRIHVKVV
jgi:hypothetical protein